MRGRHVVAGILGVLATIAIFRLTVGIIAAIAEGIGIGGETVFVGVIILVIIGVIMKIVEAIRNL